uniref:Fucolectin tachylectin-4 pentraxin-1 domain-containing protein n=1 Tax=Magallana gigas TaxID=29159 RepID=A0A8W8LNJ0_MAGGI
MHKASNAVDGIKMCFSYNLVASSSRSTQPWLLIQLDAIYSIGKVVVYARNDRYANEANNIIIYIKDIDVSNVCGGIYQGPTFNSDVIYFMCPSESRGKIVHIQKTTRDQLGFCEIEVYELL